MNDRRMPLTTAQIKSKMNGNMELAVKMAGDALEEVSSNPDIKALTKFKMASDYISMFLSIDMHIMKEENHRQDKRLKSLNTQIRQIDLEKKENGDDDSGKDDQVFKPLNQNKFMPTMN